MSHQVKAVCVLRNDRGPIGRLQLVQKDATTTIVGELGGLSCGKHG